MSVCADCGCCCGQWRRRGISHDINCSPFPIYLAGENSNLLKCFPGVVKTNSLGLMKLVHRVSCQAPGRLAGTCLNGATRAVPRWVFRSLVSRNDSGEGDGVNPDTASGPFVQGATYVRWQLVALSASAVCQWVRRKQRRGTSPGRTFGPS